LLLNMCRYVSGGMLSKTQMLPRVFLYFLDTNKTKTADPLPAEYQKQPKTRLLSVFPHEYWGHCISNAAIQTDILEKAV